MKFRTDWTPDDSYNYEDLNRVEGNTKQIQDELNALGYSLSLITKTNRDHSSFDFAADLIRVESNIGALGTAFYIPDGWEVPRTDYQTNRYFRYLDAIRLERNLELLYEMKQRLTGDFKYCGTFACGEEVL